MRLAVLLAVVHQEVEPDYLEAVRNLRYAEMSHMDHQPDEEEDR